MKKSKKHKLNTSSIIEVRRLSGLNQSQFWGMVGVTQSAGSRYETGRTIPKPVATLVSLIHMLSPAEARDALDDLRKSPAD